MFYTIDDSYHLVFELEAYFIIRVIKSWSAIIVNDEL